MSNRFPPLLSQAEFDQPPPRLSLPLTLPWGELLVLLMLFPVLAAMA